MSASADFRFYYLNNFQFVLDWIAQRDDDLLDAQERAFLALFPTLPLNARALLVRMIMRKGEFFRASRLDYPEIGDALTAARSLPSQWLRIDPQLSLEQLFVQATKPELARAFALTGALRTARKAQLLALLRADPAHAAPRRLSQWLAGSDDVLLQWQQQALCDRLRLMFFGNLRQDWSEFVLAELGSLRYERIAFSAQSRGFRRREDIDHYLHLQACKERLQAGCAPADILAALQAAQPVPGDDNAWLQSRHDRLMFQLGQLFEKQQDWAQAQQLYAASACPGARARHVRVLEKQARYGAAQALLQTALRAPESEAERQQLLRVAPRLARQLGQPRPARETEPVVEELTLVLPSAPSSSVERAVQQHLQRPDAPVFYVENTLANALFGLLCWEAIFAPVPGAFFHPFQRGPADLYSADFAARRQALFAQCLAHLEAGTHTHVILANYDAKHGLQSPFVAWGHVRREMLEMALECIPAAHLRHWCARMLDDVRENRSGFPDLIQFWPAQRCYRMIEVKGPGDRLQDNQLRWLAYCTRHAMPVAVCYLQWAQEAA